MASLAEACQAPAEAQIGREGIHLLLAFEARSSCRFEKAFVSFTLLLYALYVSDTQAAIEKVQQAIETYRPKGISLQNFLLEVVEKARPEPAGDQEEQKAKSWVLASGILARKELEQAEGGSISSEEVAELLGLKHRPSVAYKRKSRELIAWRVTTGKWRYPRWQFTANGILPGIKECLKALSVVNGFGAMIFFLSPRHSLEGKRPLDLLRDGQIKEAVAVAERHDTHAAW
jgi:hypothetical protein